MDTPIFLPLSGINYYRLRVVNYDGKFGFTPVKAARLNSPTNSVSIYPNLRPARQLFLLMMKKQRISALKFIQYGSINRNAEIRSFIEYYYD
jgi:hypothetical protein